MDGNNFYYETRTKVNVFLQEQRQITLLHKFLLPFIASGENPTRRTVILQERCPFPLHIKTNYAFFFRFGFLSLCTLDLIGNIASGNKMLIQCYDTDIMLYER